MPPNNTNPLEHKKLVKIAQEWLMSQGCHLVLSEENSGTSEVPDAIGWQSTTRSPLSILVECKASRGDFLSDKRKSSRLDKSDSMGIVKYYMIPKGMVTLQEIPIDWGLLEVDPKTLKPKVVKTPRVPKVKDSIYISELRFLVQFLINLAKKG